MLAVVMIASASADWAHSSGNPCFVTPVDGVVTAAQVTAALATQADPAVFPTDAFNGCNDLVTITLPTGITTIGNAVFANAANLAGTVIIPEGVTSIGKFTFMNNAQLTTVIFPASLERINNRVYDIFGGCTGLTTVCGATFSGDAGCGYSDAHCRAANGGSTGLATGYQSGNTGAFFFDLASMISACPAGLIPTTTSSVADEEGGACSVKCCKGTWSGTDCTPAADGRILVQHDTTSAHSHHRCYQDDTHSRLCRCQCANSADAWD
jgi:hypothetical protein